MLEIVFEAAINDGVDVTNPSKPKSGQHVAYPPSLTHAKYLLNNESREQGKRRIDLARDMNVKPPQVDRIFDIKHKSRLDQLDDMAHALGKRLVVSLEDAL